MLDMEQMGKGTERQDDIWNLSEMWWKNNDG